MWVVGLTVPWLFLLVGTILESGTAVRQKDEETTEFRCIEEALERHGVTAVKIGGDIEPPDKLVNVPPDFPQLPPGTTVIGGVWIGEILVDCDGRVADAWALREFKVKPSFPDFNGAILDAIRKWKYELVVVDGEPVHVCMIVTVNINLS